MKRSHWVIFLFVCCLLGFLVFETVVHVLKANPGKARMVHAAAPVETVPVRRQTLEEVVGGSGAVEQSNTVVLTAQIETHVTDVPVKIGDLVKRGEVLVHWDDRLIQANLDTNRQLVETSNIKIKDQARQLDRYTALERKRMGSPLDVEKSEIALADAREALA